MTNEKEWTVMIYFAGDNNLSIDMAKALFELEEIIAPIKEENSQSNQNLFEKISVLAYFDSNVSCIPPIYFDITGNKKVISLETKTIRDYLKLNTEKPSNHFESSSSEDSIVNFVKWCVEERGHRSKNYALFFSGHSNAFDGNTLLKDDDSENNLSIQGLSSALEKAVEIINADKEETKPIDIIGFDSCVMNLLEIAYEFRDSASYMIGSQGETPGDGWDYRWVVNSFISYRLSASGEIILLTPPEIAQQIIMGYIRNQNQLGMGGRSVDLSVLDLGKIEVLTNKVNQLAKTLSNLIEGYKLKDAYLETQKLSSEENSFSFEGLIENEIKKSILSAHWNCQTFWYEQAIDIQNFCEELLADMKCLKVQFDRFDDGDMDELRKIIDSLIIGGEELIKAVGDSVVETGSCGARFQFANGISLFFPWSILSYRQMVKPYLELEFSQGKGKNWVNFIELFLVNTLRRRDAPIKLQPGYWEPLETPDWLKNYGEDSLKNDTRGTREDRERGTREDRERGTREDKARGTREDRERGTREDRERGLAFIDRFKTLKNFDPDFWNFNRTFPSYYSITKNEDSSDI